MLTKFDDDIWKIEKNVFNVDWNISAMFFENCRIFFEKIIEFNLINFENNWSKIFLMTMNWLQKSDLKNSIDQCEFNHFLQFVNLYDYNLQMCDKMRFSLKKKLRIYNPLCFMWSRMFYSINKILSMTLHKSACINSIRHFIYQFHNLRYRSIDPRNPSPCS